MVPAPPPSSLDGSGNAMSPCPVREGGPRLLSLRILLCGLPFEEARRGGLCRGEGCDHSTDSYGSVWISTGQYGSVRRENCGELPGVVLTMGGGGSLGFMGYGVPARSAGKNLGQAPLILRKFLGILKGIL